MKKILIKIYNHTIGFILNLVASICMLIFVPISFLFSFLFTWWNRSLPFTIKRLNAQQESIAVAKDILLGVMLAPLLNVILIKKGSKYKFGVDQQTISYCIGKNDEENTLTKYGIKWRDRLNKADKNHCKKAVINYEKRFKQ